MEKWALLPGRLAVLAQAEGREGKGVTGATVTQLPDPQALNLTGFRVTKSFLQDARRGGLCTGKGWLVHFGFFLFKLNPEIILLHRDNPDLYFLAHESNGIYLNSHLSHAPGV